MRLERVRIEGFGHFESFELELDAGLNLVFGPNEAGKSTLLAFIRAVLFGFDKRNNPHQRYEPAKGTLGGELWLATRSGPLVVRRTGGRRAEGELSLRTPDGEPRAPTFLTDALGGISRELFCEVFAFGLSELSSFERLASQSGASQALFAAAIQGGHRYPEVSARLKRACEARFAPRGAKKELNQLLAELAEVQEALRAVGDRPSAYEGLVGRRDALDQELHSLEGALAATAAEREATGRLKAALGELTALDSAERELEALPPLADFPPDAGARLEERIAALAHARGELAHLGTSAGQAQARLEELSPQPALEALEPELRSALEGYAGRAPLMRALAGKRAALLTKKRQLGKSLEQLGLGLDADALVDVELGAAAKNRLATVRDEIAEAQRIHRERDQAAQAAKARREHIEIEVRRLTAEQQRLSQAPSALLRRRQAALARIAPLQSELEALHADARNRRREAEGVRRATDIAPAALFPLSLLVGALAGLAAVVGIAAAGWGAGVGISTAATSLLVGALLVLLQRRAQLAHRQALAGTAHRRAEREAHAASLASDLHALEARAGERGRALTEHAAEAGVPSNALAPELAARAEALTAELVQAERRESLSRELETTSSTLASAVAAEKSGTTDRDVAAARVSKLERVLEALASERSFPQGLSAERALDLWSQAADVQQRLLDVRAEQDALIADERSCGEVGELLVALARRAGLDAESAEPAAARVKDLLQAQALRASERRSALERVDLLASQRVRAEELVRQAQNALQALFAETGCADEQGVRRAVALATRFGQAHREVRERRVKLEATALAQCEVVRDQVQAGGGPAAVAARLGELEPREQDLARRRSELLDERGRVRQQLDAWEADEQVAELRSREAALSARITRGARAYAAERLGLILLGRARERYQETHQPRVLKLASRILSELTGAKYVRVQAAEDGRELLVRDASGQERSAEALSRGTREQLYLAFRLAVVEDFGQTLAPLPIVLDDILVNFDLERTRNTLDVLVRLAERHQVVAFTCHPSLKEAFIGRGARPVELGPRQQALLRLHSG